VLFEQGSKLFVGFDQLMFEWIVLTSHRKASLQRGGVRRRSASLDFIGLFGTEEVSVHQ
jgi:hypothetical protein